MKIKVVDPQVKAYGSMDENSASIATLSKGMEVEVESIKRKAGKMWVTATLGTGQRAYIPGDAGIYAIRLGSLMQDGVEMHSEAKAESSVKQILPRNTKIYILEVLTEDEKKWVHVRDMDGSEGFIDGDTRIKVIQEKTKALGRKNMLSGAMWLMIGLIVTFSGARTASGGTFAVLGYGALLYGAVILAWGAVQYFTAKA